MNIFLKKSLRQDSRADPDDVFSIKKALHQTGHYKTPSYGFTPYPDRELFDAIKDYQRDSRLKIDGVMNPGGETVTHLNKKLKDLPGAKSPIMRCTVCGGPHGGSKGGMCPDCDAKS